MQHKVRINQISSGKYACTGAVNILNTAAPIIDAALALRDAGHPDSDILSITSGECSIIPQTIAAILRPRPPSPKFALGYHLP
jgi:hypothetical protein